MRKPTYKYFEFAEDYDSLISIILEVTEGFKTFNSMEI